MKKLIACVLAVGFATSTPLPAFAGDDAAKAAHIMKTADATVGLNGLVCDFCSIALNKTFKKQDAVASTHVDLDEKSLSIVFKDGVSLDDATIVKLVKKAGYTTTKITRKDGSEFIPPSKS